MKTFFLGVVIGSVLTGAGTMANEWDAQRTVPVFPLTQGPFVGYPPSLNSLPPLPSPRWEHIQPPC